MESLKGKLDRYKLPPKKVGVEIKPFQEYAIQICKEFSLQGNYRAMIFKMAKKNMCYLQGKVENTKEKGGDLKEMGHYLISLFRKTPPWKK